MTSKEVKIFIAKDGDENVLIDKAIKRKKYTCIDCRQILIPKKGNKIRWHYAHHSKDNYCTGESWQHHFCKKFIVENKNRISMIIICPDCGCETENIELDKYDILEEHRHDKYSYDCSMSLEGEIKGVIEIFHTHKTENEKINFIHRNNLYFFEIETKQIIDMYLENEQEEFGLYSMHKTDCVQCEEKKERMQRESLEKIAVEKERKERERLEMIECLKMEWKEKRERERIEKEKQDERVRIIKEREIEEKEKQKKRNAIRSKKIEREGRLKIDREQRKIDRETNKNWKHIKDIVRSNVEK